MTTPQQPITLPDLIQLRLMIQQISSPSEELSKATIIFDNHIAAIIASFQVTKQDTTTNG